MLDYIVSAHQLRIDVCFLGARYPIDFSALLKVHLLLRLVSPHSCVSSTKCDLRPRYPYAD